jgi:CRISPR-associated protein Csm3
MSETVLADAYRLVKKVFIEGWIEALTGVHIGGSSVGISIGGIDAAVVRNPFNDEPYIPGSSLRGKMRSLMEKAHGDMHITIKEEVKDTKGVYVLKRSSEYDSLEKIQDCDLLAKFGGEVRVSAAPSRNAFSDVGILFGVSADNVSATPTRLIVRDAMLTDKSKQRLEKAPNTDMPMTEVKTEVWIDRITSAATPRQLERVPAGAKFNFEMVLNLYGNDKRDELLKKIWEGLELIEGDYLGGKGGRGCGQVKFSVVGVWEKNMQAYREGTGRIKLEAVTIPECLRPKSEPAELERLQSDDCLQA